MSLPRDPFDLIETGKSMDNIIPFLAPNKINHMIDTALSHQQLTPQKKPAFLMRKTWWSGGLATAACAILLLSFMPSTNLFTLETATPQQTASTADDINEFSELVMLDTWERY